MSDDGKRWVRVGHSATDGERVAVAEAAATAMGGPDPKLLVVFAPAHCSPHDLAESIDEVVSGVPVIGCSATGHIGSGGRPDVGVVVVGFGGDFDVDVASGTNFNARPREVGAEVSTALYPLPEREHHLVLMLTDNLAGDQQEMVRGAYSVLGAAIPLIGGVAGYGVIHSPSWLLYQGKVLQDAVVAARLSSDQPIGVSVKHGWHVEGEGMIATASVHNQVYTLDDRPALDVFLARHEAPPGIETKPDAFEVFALGRPLAIARRGEIAVRHVQQADPRTRSLICAAAVPKGAAVWLATTDLKSTLDATDAACREALDSFGDVPPTALLIFDCAGRRTVLRSGGLHQEWQRMREHAGDLPIAGFYGNGEIARLRGTNGFHNQTFVACALG